MILICDSGSTKTDWVALDELSNDLFSTTTLGLNPEVITRETLKDRLEDSTLLYENRHKVEQIYFYGAGCGTVGMKILLKEVLENIFSKAKIVVKEDTYAAAFATVDYNKPSIVCILGTGSNCSYWGGKSLHQKVESLGYILMDDCSGNYYGKILIRDYYFNLMPHEIKLDFEKEFDLDAEVIKKQIYKKPNPNRYLAGFAKFLIIHKEKPYFQKMIFEGIKLFLRNFIFQYEDSAHVPIHFVGGIAFRLKEEIEAVLDEVNLKAGNIIRRPIDGMISYHKSHIINQ